MLVILIHPNLFIYYSKSYKKCGCGHQQIKITCTIYFQSKLNCEVLYDDLAFEVRWAVAGESVVVQLVAKLGKKLVMIFLNFLY